MVSLVEVLPHIARFNFEQKKVFGQEKNTKKPHWSTLSPNELNDAITKNQAEMVAALDKHDFKTAQDRTIDIANLCVLLYDNLDLKKD